MNNNIYLPNVPLTNCQEFICYWDHWHKEWYKWVIEKCQDKQPIKNDILGWPIPNGNIWQDFPEPYWGNPCAPQAVFININPAGSDGGLNACVKPVDPLYKLYLCEKVYAKTINKLGNCPNNNSAKWFNNKRAKWAEEISSSCGKVANPGWTVNDILCVDLVPWHTPKAAQIDSYLQSPAVCDLIMNKVLIPAISISKTINKKCTFHGIIIGRGKAVQEKISSLCLQTIQKSSPGQIYCNKINKSYWKFTTLIYNTIDVTCRIYIGRGNMSLPKSTQNFTDSNGSQMPALYFDDS